MRDEIDENTIKDAVAAAVKATVRECTDMVELALHNGVEFNHIKPLYGDDGRLGLLCWSRPYESDAMAGPEEVILLVQNRVYRAEYYGAWRDFHSSFASLTDALLFVMSSQTRKINALEEQTQDNE